MEDAMQSKVGICFIFNHPFPGQIPIIKKLYEGRFSKMLFLVPYFEDDEDEDVYTVYHGAFSFDAMVVDARHRIKEKFKDCSHLLFVHNDLLISGRFNETTTADILNLANGPFIAHMSKLGGTAFDWVWKSTLPHKWRFPMDQFLGTGAEKAREYFPTRASIDYYCKLAGFDAAPSQLARDDERVKERYQNQFIHEQIYTNPQHTGESGAFDLEYPLFVGYSDIFAVPMDDFDKWVRNLGVLSSMRVFPEIAIPTSLVWSFGPVSTQGKLGLKTAILWQDRHLTDDINWVIEKFDEGLDYIHPVKYEQYDAGAYSGLMSALRRS